MYNNNKHYYSPFPDARVKLQSISVSLRRHLFIFKTITGVFAYKKLDLGTKILVENMIIPPKSSTIIDLGCGYGAIGIVLAYKSPKSTVYLIDINRRAIWCAKENIKINLPESKDRVFALSGNYFEPMKNKNIIFDGIFMNPPLRKGRKEFLNLFDEIPLYLKPNGVFQFVIKRKMGAEFVSNYLKNKFSKENVEIICKKSGYWIFKYIQE
jgi:16S rRNA (guanine1207-N2)-methyltransferase